MKVYYGQNKKGTWLASLDEEKLAKFNTVYSCDLDVIHNNKVYMIKTYYGFDYTYGTSIYGGSSIYDVIAYSGIYHSILSAKKSKIWSEREKLAKKYPEDYHVDNLSIASDDYGEPFIYGDCFAGKFNMKIIRVKVI